MKSFTILHILLLLILLIAYQCIQAQDYLITQRGDTIKGEIKPMNFGSEKKVQVTDANKKKSTYSFYQVKSYAFRGDVYQPVKGPQGYAFMKLLRPGYLSLFAYQLENQVTYDGLYLTKKDGSGSEVPNLGFKKVMKKFLEECPNVTARIDEGFLSKKELNQIIDEYNNCISNKTNTHNKAIAKQAEQTKKLNAWDVLQDKVENHPDFEAKADALDMIKEIKSKLAKGEKVPKFLSEGLKESLSSIQLNAELEAALQEIK